MRHSTTRRGLSLIELLVTLAIIAILIGILIPTIAAVRRAARVTQCASNLRQLGQAIHAYRADCRTWPYVTYMPAPYQWPNMGPRSPSLNVALARYVAPDSPIYRCPGDEGEVFDRCAAQPAGHGISYTSWMAFPNFPNKCLMNDFQGVGGPGFSFIPPEFHPPRRGMNQLEPDGSVAFGHAQPGA